MHRLIAALSLTLLLAGCGGIAQGPIAPLEEVQRRAYVHEGPAELALYTVINNRTGGGAHTALMINGSQRVLWDPAGSFVHGHVPERYDLLYGITGNVELAYTDYHVRDTHHVVVQRVTVSPGQAEMALRLAEDHGGAANATCARSTSGILKQIPGFESIGRTFYPKSLMADFGAIPGVVTRKVDGSNVDTSHNVIFAEPTD